MLVLAIDSTVDSLSVSLADNGTLLGETCVTSGKNHSVALLPAINGLFAHTGKSLDDVALIAVCAGPGSYTGVRIAAATAKGLAFGRDVPVVPVSTLETLASPFAYENAIICPLIDARRGNFYTACFKADGASVTRLCEDCESSGDDLAGKLSSYGERVVLVGDGARKFDEKYNLPCTCTPGTRFDKPSAYYAAVLAERTHSDAENKEEFTAAALRPVYLKKTQAERELEEREGKKNV